LNYKKPSFWVLFIGFIAIALITFGLISNPKTSAQGLSFLDIKEVGAKVNQKQSLMLRYHGNGASLIAGDELKKWLDNVSNSWQQDKEITESEFLPTLTVYTDSARGYQLSFYKGKPETARVFYQGKVCFYKIPKENYDDMYVMWAIRNYSISEAFVEAITSGQITNIQSVNDTPNGGQCKKITVGNRSYFIYEQNGKYYCEEPYVRISEITQQVYRSADELIDKTVKQENSENSSQISNSVEDNLNMIMSLPKQSSNPEDYIKANSKAYENILKHGEESLSYMLSQFEHGNAEGLRGQIMMRICIELLGQRNNVTDKSLSPMDWFSQLQIRQKVALPDFKYTGDDVNQKLVYETEAQRNIAKYGEFTIVAPHIFGSYEQDNKLKIFATIYSQSYILYDKTLSEEGGSVIPVAITYVKNTDGSYSLEKYEQAQDGSHFAPSIKQYCVMPVSGKKINGLYDEILKHYGNYEDIKKLERENLIQHLKANNQNGVKLYQKQYQKEDELIPIT
jgi:hypothetical protein